MPGKSSFVVPQLIFILITSVACTSITQRHSTFTPTVPIEITQVLASIDTLLILPSTAKR